MPSDDTNKNIKLTRDNNGSIVRMIFFMLIPIWLLWDSGRLAAFRVKEGAGFLETVSIFANTLVAAITVIWAGIGMWPFTMIKNGVNIWALAGFLFLVGASTGAIIGIKDAVQNMAVAGFIILLETGFSAWVRSLIILFEKIKKDFPRFLTPLAYPYFLWFPVTLFFSFRLVNNILPLPWTIAIFAATISLCTLL